MFGVGGTGVKENKNRNRHWYRNLLPCFKCKCRTFETIYVMPTFQSLGLDARLLRALEKRGFTEPTAVQAECISAALKGRDIITHARTGSGKTLAYVLPALQRLLEAPLTQQALPWQTLILVPTRELCEQVKQEAVEMASSSGMDIRVTALTATGAAEREQFLHIGQIVVATPGRIAQAFKTGRLRPQFLQPHTQSKRPGLSLLILDEADLILSMPGYEQDLKEIAPKIPRSCQCMLMSATMNEAVEELQKLVLQKPITLDLACSDNPDLSTSGPQAPGGGSAIEIQHFGISCAREDKLLVVMTLLKLDLVRRKVLLFVNTIDAGFRLRLFLESFGLRSASINAELPMNSRHHILEEFNRGVFDYLIATDDARKSAAAEAEGPPDVSQKKGKKRKRPEADQEFGVTRGIDFKGVETVINVDAPSSVSNYVHRVGRTGRGGNSGTAISLLTPADEFLEQEVAASLPQRPDSTDEGTAEPGAKQKLEPFKGLQKANVEALRYRAEDIARSLTSKVIKEARAKELRLELINSQRLVAHFQQHPGDLALLKHDKTLAKRPEAPHLKHLPPYLRAAGLPSSTGPAGVLSTKKRKKHNKGVDPIKGGFMKAPRRIENEPLTEMEKNAEKLGKKLAKKQRKSDHSQSFVPKRNVRKKR